MIAFGKRLDDVTDIPQSCPRFDNFNGFVEALAGHIYQSHNMGGRFVNHKHLAGIPVIPVLDDSDVYIDDVTFLEDLGVTWNTMADHVIDGCADRFGETVVIERSRDGLLHIDYIVVTNSVEFASADAGLDMRPYHFQHIGGQAAGHTHFLDFIRRFDTDSHGLERLLRLLYWVIFQALPL